MPQTRSSAVLSMPVSGSAEKTCDVCVVGDGVIGKTTALALAQTGLNVTLVGPPLGSSIPNVPALDSLDHWDLRVFALNRVARDLLSSLRVWDALDLARVSPVSGMEIRGDGRSAADKIEFDAYAARVDALAWIVEHRNLNQALDSALRFAHQVQILHGRAVQLLHTENAVRLQFETGESVLAALVVGADGGQSWLRHQMDIGVDYHPYRQSAVVANFACEHPHRGIARQWFSGADGIVALLPLAGQRVSLVWSAPQALADTLARESLSQLAQRLMQLPSQPFGQLQPLQPEQQKAFPLALIRAHALIAARVALVGDAAHVVHPLAGHGMNLGFADVAQLVATIGARGVGQDCGAARVLERFARARKEDVLLMQITTDGLQRLFATDLEPIRLLRNLGLNLVNRLPYLKRRLMQQALGRSPVNLN